MFTSFAQLASTLEASLSLDALQVPADGTKKSDDNSNITNKKETAKDEKPLASNPRGADETEILLVEEVSRLSELLRSKNEECSTTMSKLSESLGNLQSQKLAFSDLSDELKALKVSSKLSSQDYEDKLSSAGREMCDLRDEVSRLQKVVEDGNEQRNLMQMQLSASPIVDVPDAGENSETEQSSQLHHENASLKREISQNSISLSQAKQQISSLEGLLEDAKTSRRLNEDKLSKYERDLASLTERLSTAESDRLSEVESYEKKLKDMAATESMLESTHASNIAAITFAKSEAENALLQQKASYDALNESFVKLNKANLEKISEMEDLYRSVAGASDSVEQEKSLRNIAQTELSNLREQLEEKSKSISELQHNLAQKDSSIEALDKELSLKNSAIAELQAKQVTLTEKTKDIVKKYSEIKAKNQSLELASGDKSAEALQQLQNKVKYAQLIDHLHAIFNVQ
jgi:chromosome segregation ATPase